LAGAVPCHQPLGAINLINVSGFRILLLLMLLLLLMAAYHPAVCCCAPGRCLSQWDGHNPRYLIQRPRKGCEEGLTLSRCFGLAVLLPAIGPLRGPPFLGPMCRPGSCRALCATDFRQLKLVCAPRRRKVHRRWRTVDDSTHGSRIALASSSCMLNAGSCGEAFQNTELIILSSRGIAIVRLM
jgi:hypothetical protein